MKRDKYGRFISNKTEGIDKGKPKRDSKGRFLPKEQIATLQKEANDQLVHIRASSEERDKVLSTMTLPKLPEPIYWPESPGPINLPEPPQLSDMLINLSKTNRQKYTIDDIRKAYIAGLNDSQGILSISKRFEMYCKRNGIE